MRTFFIVLLLTTFWGTAQNVTAPFIKTVLLQTHGQKGAHCFFPKGEKIIVSFDDLHGDVQNYRYHLQHCDSNWNPSEVNVSDYIEGFDNGFIETYENSVGTLQNYTHYTFSFPNAQTKIISSGNYILTVYKDFQEHFILKRKLVIYENALRLTAKITRANFDINKKQMLTVSVYYGDLSIAYPQRELVVKILQNNDWNTCKTSSVILFSDAQKVTYRDDGETTFFGGNEFYFFDSKNLNAEDFQVQKTFIQEGLFHTFLYPKKLQMPLSYKFNPDIDGNFITHSLNAFHAKNQSDYTWVHFYLEADFLNPKDTLYVYGAFNAYATQRENQMLYDEAKKSWTAKILLKQGFYNYKFVKRTGGKIAPRGLSGSFFQTQNTYIVIVYYRPLGAFIQKAVAVQQFK